MYACMTQHVVIGWMLHADPRQPSPSSLGKSCAKLPQGRSPPQSLVIADSEEPLVLPRQHGPATKAFQGAHALPCSSPRKSPTRSPPDPLCSFVPATADATSPHKKASKSSSPAKSTAARPASSPTPKAQLVAAAEADHADKPKQLISR